MKREDRERIRELREEIRMKTKHPNMKGTGIRLLWTGDIETRSEEKPTRRAWKTEEGGSKRRGN